MGVGCVLVVIFGEVGVEMVGLGVGGVLVVGRDSEGGCGIVVEMGWVSYWW